MLVNKDFHIIAVISRHISFSSNRSQISDRFRESNSSLNSADSWHIEVTIDTHNIFIKICVGDNVYVLMTAVMCDFRLHKLLRLCLYIWQFFRPHWLRMVFEACAKFVCYFGVSWLVDRSSAALLCRVVVCRNRRKFRCCRQPVRRTRTAIVMQWRAEVSTAIFSHSMLSPSTST